MEKHNSHILLADDDVDDLDLLSAVMQELDVSYNIVHANDGEEALVKLNEMKLTGNLPCLIVLDINMPKMLGPELLVVFRSHPKFDTVPIVMLSTSMPEDMRRQLLKSGANYAVQKPYQVDGFAKLIAAVLGKWRS